MIGISNTVATHKVVGISDIVTAPETQASGFVFSDVGGDKLTASITRGSGEAVLVVARIGEPVTDFPINGQEYTASSVFGQGDEVGLGNFVVHNGNGVIGEITGFNAGDEVYFRAFERNGTIYNTDPAIGNPSMQVLASQPTGLVSYYTLNETSGPAIDSHRGNNSNSNNATQGTSGKIGNAYGYALNLATSIDSVVANVFDSNVGSFNVWVSPNDETPSNAGVILAFGDTDVNTSIRLFLLPNGKVGIAVTFNGSNRWRIETNAAVLSAATFSMITVVQNGISPVLYINGVAVPQSFTVSVDITEWLIDCPGIDNGRIGCLNAQSSGNSTFWAGLIDEVSIWNRPLTTDEITALYNSGSGLAYPLTGITLD